MRAKAVSTSHLEPKDLSLDLLWDVPLAVVSWGFFHLNKALISRLYQRYLDRQADRSQAWRLLSEETLSLPVSLPVLLTKGPRWNTHASIGTLGPLSVDHQLAVATDQANKSAGAWSIVIYRYPDFQTWQEIGSLEPTPAQGWTVLSLPKGRYCLGVRYYDLQDQAVMPAVRLDDATTDSVLAEAVPQGLNAVYGSLASRTNLYFRALHHYVYPMLRLRRWLPQPWVRREYLPVGDPFTTFRYDWFPAGRALKIQVAARLHDDFRLFLSVYNRASLPVHSCVLGAGETLTPVFPHAGFYLIRLRPRRLNVLPCRDGELRVLRCQP
ncbi:MAG: DUF6208 family protein [Cyanobium sp.]